MNFIRKSTETYGKAKLLLRENEYYIESESKAVATRLLREPAIKVRATRLSNYIHIDARVSRSVFCILMATYTLPGGKGAG